MTASEHKVCSLWLFICTHCLPCPVGGLYVVHTDMFICAVLRLRHHPTRFWAEGQWVCWTPVLPAVVRSPEGTVHLVNMAATAASTGLVDTWLPARQPVGCPQASKTAGQGKQHGVCAIQSRHESLTEHCTWCRALSECLDCCQKFYIMFSVCCSSAILVVRFKTEVTEISQSLHQNEWICVIHGISVDIHTAEKMETENT